MFLTVDPLVSATTQPYGYASQDPINQLDPDGYCAASLPPGGGADLPSCRHHTFTKWAGTVVVQANPANHSLQWNWWPSHRVKELAPNPTVTGFIWIDGNIHTYAPHAGQDYYHGSRRNVPHRAAVIILLVATGDNGTVVTRYVACRMP